MCTLHLFALCDTTTTTNAIKSRILSMSPGTLDQLSAALAYKSET